jgi:hypothetical protein
MVNRSTAGLVALISALSAIVYLADAVFFERPIMYLPFVMWFACAIIWANILNLFKDD